MSIALFKTLLAVVDRGSFSGAADAVNLSQAAVGQQMKRLEGLLRVSLFDRSQKAPQLNPAARGIVPRMRELVEAYDRLLDDPVGDGELHGELVLGAVPSSIRALVPLSIKTLVRDYPNLRVRVVPGLSSDMVEQVERGSVDCAIMTEPGSMVAHLNWQPLAEEALVLLTAPDELVFDPVELLSTRPFIRHTRRAAVGLLADQWLKDHQIVVNASMEMESIESVASMVSHNLGVSIVPSLCVPDSIFSAMNQVPLPPPRPSRKLGLLSRTDSSRVRLIDQLFNKLLATIEARQ